MEGYSDSAVGEHFLFSNPGIQYDPLSLSEVISKHRATSKSWTQRHMDPKQKQHKTKQEGIWEKNIRD